MCADSNTETNRLVRQDRHTCLWETADFPRSAIFSFSNLYVKWFQTYYVFYKKFRKLPGTDPKAVPKKERKSFTNISR